jgi:hypothetical protein
MRFMAISLEKMFGRLSKGDSESDSPSGPRGLAALRKHRTSEGVSSRAEWLGHTGVRSSISITIRDVSSDGISFFSHEKFKVHQTLWIKTGAIEITKAVVRQCERQGRFYVIESKVVVEERRSGERSPVSGAAMLRWEHSDGGFCHAAVLVCNASDSGMQLESSVPVGIGTTVNLTGAILRCDGAVRYCHESGDRFVIGVEITRTFSKESRD